MKKYSILLVALLLVAAGCEGLLGGLGDPSKGEFKIPEGLASLFESLGMGEQITEGKVNSKEELQDMMDESTLGSHINDQVALARSYAPSAEIPIVINTISLEYRFDVYYGAINNEVYSLDQSYSGGYDGLPEGTIIFSGPRLLSGSVFNSVTIAAVEYGGSNNRDISAGEIKVEMFEFPEVLDSTYGVYNIGSVFITTSRGARSYLIQWVEDPILSNSGEYESGHSAGEYESSHSDHN